MGLKLLHQLYLSFLDFSKHKCNLVDQLLFLLSISHRQNSPNFSHSFELHRSFSRHHLAHKEASNPFLNDQHTFQFQKPHMLSLNSLLFQIHQLLSFVLFMRCLSHRLCFSFFLDKNILHSWTCVNLKLCWFQKVVKCQDLLVWEFSVRYQILFLNRSLWLLLSAFNKGFVLH